MVHVARRRATVVPAPGDVPQVAEPPPIKTDPIRPSAAPAPGKIVFPRLQRNNPRSTLTLVKWDTCSASGKFSPGPVTEKKTIRRRRRPTNKGGENVDLINIYGRRGKNVTKKFKLYSTRLYESARGRKKTGCDGWRHRQGWCCVAASPRSKWTRRDRLKKLIPTKSNNKVETTRDLRQNKCPSSQSTL
jgi:hypothetical protein